MQINEKNLRKVIRSVIKESISSKRTYDQLTEHIKKGLLAEGIFAYPLPVADDNDGIKGTIRSDLNIPYIKAVNEAIEVEANIIVNKIKQIMKNHGEF